ncbi:MAG TPA: NAD(P)-binding domain-containing protein, partial [Candidatus Dojkabacteria bacterium]|nr:NAD(P)-binding domain-containing protein [Candidatus Dojkabacteria bacterium]
MKKEIGFIGLGSMGLNMVYKLLDEDYIVHAWNRSEGARLEAE